MSDSYVANAEELQAFSGKILEKHGVSKNQAEDAAHVLTWASLRGIDTHGIRNLKRYYVDGIAAGQIKPDAVFEIESETSIAARTNGCAGLGLAAAQWAMRLVIEKAEHSGMGFVSMRNSNHLGAAGCHAYMAVHREMIGIAMTGYFFANGNQVGLAPTFGLTPVLGTNPLAIAVPCESEPPFVLDMSTTTVPQNRIELHSETGREIPAGWGLDVRGASATDPASIALLTPLGGNRDQGGHKGFGLAMMVQILTGVLSGGWWHNPERNQLLGNPPEDSECYAQEGVSHFFGAIRLDQFGPSEQFRQAMDAMMQVVHNSETEPGREKVYVAGEIEHATQQNREATGIPLTSQTGKELLELAKAHGIPLSLEPLQP